MAEDEQFSLCWNNFNSNLSAGFHESLCRGDLVDVTLAAEGQLVKAHRLVLSVCSPYFRKMFTQMPSNQHAFVFLKDVSHSALKDLIQFMYCGEVNVKQDALPAFISTAEALQIKGLTETGENVPQTQQHTTGTTTVLAASSPAPTITKETTARITTVPVHQTIATTSRPIKISRPTAATYKLESEDSSDDKVVHAITVQAPTVKRTQKSITPQSAPASKRIKITTTTADPLEAVEPTQITIQDKDDEFINLPIETLNTKSEPHDSQYGDQASAQVSEVETQEDNSAYVEDDGGYADMTKYDESYFTEGDEKPGQSSFGESFTGTTEQGQEAQVAHQNDSKIDTNKNSSQAQSMNKNENNELVPVCDIKEETADSDDELQLSHQETFGINSRIPEMFNFSPSPSNLLSTLSGRQRRINSFGIPFEYVPYGSHRATPDGNNLLFKGYRYYKDGANIYKKSREIRIYWRCINIPGKCRARLHTSIDYYVVKVVGDHQLSCLLKMATASRYNVDRLPTFK